MPAPTDPIDLLTRLSADDLAERIERLDGERAQLMVLLRSARARERREARTSCPAPTSPPAGQGAQL